MAGESESPQPIPSSEIPGSQYFATALNKDAEVYVVGYPQDFGGKVTEEWLEAIKADPAAYGRLYGEFVKNIMSQNPENARIVLHGMSLGTTPAELAAKTLSVEDRKKVQLLLDNPVGNHGPLTIILKALQIPGGFLAEAVSRIALDERVRASTLAAQPFLNRLRDELSAKGIDWADSSEQKKMKLKAALVDVWNQIKGSPFDTENVRSFIRQGIADPVSFPSAAFREILSRKVKNIKVENKIVAKKRGKSLEFGIGATHFISRYRADKWARIVSTFLSPSTSLNV